MAFAELRCRIFEYVNRKKKQIKLIFSQRNTYIYSIYKFIFKFFLNKCEKLALYTLNWPAQNSDVRFASYEPFNTVRSS